MEARAARALVRSDHRVNHVQTIMNGHVFFLARAPEYAAPSVFSLQAEMGPMIQTNPARDFQSRPVERSRKHVLGYLTPRSASGIGPSGRGWPDVSSG